ncbi:MAG: hypothetical protein GYA87_09345 [Christensenellaceae bacterium]|nr:hypothetical protein [Christensenellaceae bacterium]
MGPYKYAYYVYKDGERIRTTAYKENLGRFIHNYTESGTYKVIAFVKDRLGKIKTHTIDNLVINLPNEPTISEFRFSTSSTSLGNLIYPYLVINNVSSANIAYNVFKDGVLYYKSKYQPCYGEMGLYFRPSHTGVYTYQVIVRNFNGNIITAYTSNSCEVIEP